jgi:ubiquinone/menaquinone biosynthesis C-methylase UbiE
MNHADHIELLRGGVTGTVWADFGSGAGAFTLALAELLGLQGEIFSVDQNTSSLREQERNMRSLYPNIPVHYHNTDYTRWLDLPALDGIVAANTLHFHKNKLPIVNLLKSYLRPTGRFIVIEYNISMGNFAVPHPLPFTAWEQLAKKAGFASTTMLKRRPSRFMNEIYSAMSDQLTAAEELNGNLR